MKRFPLRIPSLAVSFEDFKYLEDVAACVKTLFDFPRSQTVFQVMNQSLSRSPPLFHYEPLLVTGMKAKLPGQIDLISQEGGTLYSSCGTWKVCGLVQSCWSRTASKILLRQPRKAQNQLAKEAYRLGFRSAKITTILSKDPDCSEARRSLLRARDLGTCQTISSTPIEAT
jgi:hypothetical protein